MATLVVISGPGEGQKFALEDHRLAMVGRDHSCTFQILDRRISRYHLQIKSSDTGHAAIDFESSNGVFVNGKKIDGEQGLGNGDIVTIGDTAIMYTETDEPDAQTISQLMRKHGEGRCQTEVRRASDIMGL